MTKIKSNADNGEKAVVKRIMKATPPVTLHAYAGDFYSVADVRRLLGLAYMTGRNDGISWSTARIIRMLGETKHE